MTYFKGRMRYRCLFAISTLSLFSCNHDSAIRRNALEYESITELNNIVEYYTQCYYKMPENKNDIISFLKDWRQADSTSYCYLSIDGTDITDYIKSHSLGMASYEDSVFLFDNKARIGCCVYGTPKYWLEHPEQWPPERMDYQEIFKTAAFDNKGKYIWGYNYHGFNKGLSIIGNQYRFTCLSTYHRQSELSSGLIITTTPFKVLFSYDVDSNTMKVIASMPNFEMTSCFENTSQSVIVENKIELASSIENHFEQYLIDLRDFVNSYIQRNGDVKRLIFLSPMYFNKLPNS